MSESAHVTSVDALASWRADLCTFTQQAKDGLCAVDMEIQHTLDWLEDQHKFWHSAVRRGEDEVFQAKNELARRRMMRIGDRPPDCSEQEAALKKAQAKLEYAQEQLHKTRRWLRTLPEDVRQYYAPARQLQAALEQDLVQAQALLERQIAALDEYLHIAPPEGIKKDQ